MSTTAITITNPLPAVLVALSGETMELLDAILTESHQAMVTDVATYERANALYKRMHAFSRDVEANRKTLKAPVIDVGRKIDEAAQAALLPLDDQKRSLGQKIKDFEAVENQRREAARLAAEAEARRIEAERIAAAEAERQRQQEAAEFDALPDVAVEPLPIFDAPIVKAVVPAYVAPALKGAVRSTTAYELVIDHPALIPREYLVPNESAIKAYLKTGMKVPGCSLREVATTAAKGR